VLTPVHCRLPSKWQKKLDKCSRKDRKFQEMLDAWDVNIVGLFFTLDRSLMRKMPLP